MRESVLGKTTEDEGEAAGSYKSCKAGEGGAKPKEAAHRDVDYSYNKLS